jgi:hypothetical protein
MLWRRPADRAEDRNLAQRLLGEGEGVVQQRHVGEVVGVQVADPDGVQILDPDVVLQRAQHTTSDINEHVRAACLEQESGARLIRLGVRRVAQRRQPDRALWLPPLDHVRLLWTPTLGKLAATQECCRSSLQSGHLRYRQDLPPAIRRRLEIAALARRTRRRSAAQFALLH